MKKIVTARLFFLVIVCFRTGSLFAQWSAILTGATDDMNCVSLVGSQIFIGGDLIVKSPDGGASWSVNTLKHASGFELIGTSLNDIHFFDAQNGVAVGLIEGAGQDIILRSTDGGASWSYAYQGFGNGGAFFILYDLFFINSTTGWAVGSNGNIYKTVNAGVSWAVQATGTVSSLYSVFFVDANLGFAAGDNVLLKTLDGGANWSPTSLDGAERVAFADPNTGYAGSGNTLYKTTDGGQNWTLLPLPEVSGYLTDLHLIGPQTCYALFTNTVLRSTDGGQSWEETAGSSAFNLARQFEWLNDQQAVAVGGAVFCWVTTNAGAPYKPMADYAIPQPLCSGVPQTIANETADLPNYTYQWLLDGIPVSTQRNPDIIFPNPGTTYQLRLEVSNGAATDVAEYFMQTTPLVQLATPNLFPTGNQLCQGDPLVLYAELNNAAVWTLSANGQPTGLGGNLVQISYPDTPQITTTYQLHGELAGVCNTALADAETTVTVTPLPVAVEILAEKPFVCPGETTRILIPNSVPGVAYRLYAFSSAGNPNETQTGNGDTLFFQTPPVQDYLYYQLEVSNQNCLRNFGQMVTVAPEFLLAVLHETQTFGAVGTPMQLNDTFNLSGNIIWEFGPLALPPTATGLDPVFQYTEPGFYTFYVKSVGQGSCMAGDSMLIEVFGQNNFPASSMALCDEYPTTLLATRVETQEQILDVHRTADGTTYTIGYRSENYSGLRHNLSIHKIGSDGSEIWSYFLPYSAQAADVVQRIGTSIAADEAGNMYITGTYYGSEISLGGQIIYSGWPTLEAFVAKLDPQGNLLWHIRMPGAGAPVGVTDLLYLNDQQIYLVAPETFVFEFPDGFKYKFQSNDLLGMIQIDADGHFVRARPIAQTATDEYHVLLSNFNPNLAYFVGPATTRISPRMGLDKQGRIVLVGEFRSPMLAGGQLLTPNIMQQRNGFVVHTDQNMDVLGAFTTYGVADISIGSSSIFHQISGSPSFALDEEGNIVQSFYIDHKYTYQPPFHYAEILDDVVEYGDDSHFLLKYGADGDLLWYRRNGPLASPWLATVPDGGIYALASFYRVLGLNDPDGTKRGLVGPGQRDIALLSWDKNGAATGALPLGTAGEDLPGWLLSDDCGGLAGLLAKNVGTYFNNDSLQYYRLVEFGPLADDCAQVCPFEICQQPQALVFCRGGDAWLYVGAAGDNLSYQWQRETAPGVHANLADDAVYSGTQTALLQISAVEAPALAGQQYRCLVTNSFDSTIVSGSAVLLPLDTPVVAPLPPVTPVSLNQFTYLVAQAAGDGLQYEWEYLALEGWRPVAGLAFYLFTNEDSMLIKAYLPSFQNGQQLRCRIFNAEGCFVYTTVTTLQFVSETADPAAPELAVRVGPSPFTDALSLTVETNGGESVCWTVFDVNGREILRQTAAAQQTTTLPTRSWPPGVYQIRAECDGRVVWKRVVKGN
ncbi:MAG: T9SS type A sorting domain-containing protein [Saprospiraceae bacterium]|nr:T9SS type A sorting domain-containing protein [Saprospiraceae bacterium]